jgi:hypothetical protein
MTDHLLYYEAFFITRGDLVKAISEAITDHYSHPSITGPAPLDRDIAEIVMKVLDRIDGQT